MPQTATGTFQVNLEPLDLHDALDNNVLGITAFGRRSIAKQFLGDIVGHSVGEMMSVLTETKGSAAYVALEHVVATLQGQEGTFVLQHASSMNRGAATQRIVVVPDSGTGKLLGLAGEMEIQITDGIHHYTFFYTL